MRLPSLLVLASFLGFPGPIELEAESERFLFFGFEEEKNGSGMESDVQRVCRLQKN